MGRRFIDQSSSREIPRIEEYYTNAVVLPDEVDCSLGPKTTNINISQQKVDELVLNESTVEKSKQLPKLPKQLPMNFKTKSFPKLFYVEQKVYKLILKVSTVKESEKLPDIKTKKDELTDILDKCSEEECTNDLKSRTKSKLSSQCCN